MAYGTVNVGQAQSENNNYLTNENVGVPGGLATLNASGELTESQRWEVDAYTKAQADQKVSDAVNTHNTSPTAHPDILAAVAALETEVEALNLKFGTDVTGNAFSVTFSTLDDVIVTGVWNTAQARVEF
mgnify:FL=1